MAEQEMHWYALYTRSRFEKRVKQLLEEQQIEVFLPTMQVYRKWSDRMKKVEVPLFNSYIFVRTCPCLQNHYYRILQTPGAVRFIHFDGKPVPVPDHQIETLRRITRNGFPVQEIDKPLQPGTPVEIMHGPLKGIKGEVKRAGSNQLLIIQVDILDKCIQVTLPGGYVEAV